MTHRNCRQPAAIIFCALAALLFMLPVTNLYAQPRTQVPQTSAAKSDTAGLPKHAKLSTPLAQLARKANVSVSALPEPSRSALITGRMKMNSARAVQVYIRVADLGPANLNALKAAGVTIQLTDKKRNIVQSMVPAAALQKVAALPFVNSISLPQYGYANTGSVTTQGDTVLKADKVRSQLGVTGKGIRVGVIADGITGIFASGCTACSGVAGGPISTGDLPAATGTRSATGLLTSTTGSIVAKSFRASDGDLEAGLAGVGNEGTAMMEVIYDLAPDVTFYFANFQTDIEFADAMNWLAQNTEVVVGDISFFDPPYDGTNAVSKNAATALNTDANPVRALITSVGNEGVSHYLEAYTDSGVDSSSITSTVVPGYTGNFHKFQATTATTDVCGMGARTNDVIFVRNGWGLNVTLTWDDPYVSTNDYDLWLLDSTGKVIAYSANLQNGGIGGQAPLEWIEYVNNGPDAFFYIAITNANNAAAPKHLNLFIRGADQLALHAADYTPPLSCPSAVGQVHNFNTPGGSVPAMGDAGGTPVSVISVGAAPVTNTNSIEPYSSNGPTMDGRLKPDITGVDLVEVTGAGGFVNPFWGTSAAAPHVAGIAALLLQASPCLAAGSNGARLPADARGILYNALTRNAFDLGAPGPDNVFGHGLADGIASAITLTPTASAGGDKSVTATGPDGATVTFDATGSSDPSSCPLTYNWSGDCGTATGANPSLKCPVGTNNVTLTVSNNGGVTKATATSVVTVTTTATPATMTSPTNGSTLSGSSVTFTWGSVTSAQQYWMWIGTTPGGMELYNNDQALNTSVTVNNLPTNGAPVYVRLFTVLNGTWHWNDYTYNAATPSAATMLSPANHATLTGSSATFTWGSVTAAQQYWIWIGTTSGGMDLYNQGQALNTSATVNNLPTNGAPVYVRLFTVLNDTWHWNDYTYTAAAPTPATMLTPANGATLTGSSATFTWGSVTAAQQYWLWIGTTSGSMDLYNQGQALNTSATVNNLPTNGAPLYVRLFTVLNDTWHWNDYTYTAAAATPATMITPVNGATLPGTSATFTWNSVSSAQQYWLWIGTASGSMDLYNQGQGLNTSVTVNNLPANGAPVYVRLFTVLNGTWHWNDYTYTAAAPSAATMMTPANGATLPGTSVTFTWNSVSSAQLYWMWIGTTSGSMDLYNQGQDLNTSATVSNLPANGAPVYVRLFTMISGNWQWNDYSYTAAP